MALRVLLADESSSIKKVMQLALQDFAVEVKAVPVGLDVCPVAKTWHPDIIFVDILLAKKSGYEVCAELKNHKELSSIPIVLMWSSFMNMDEQKASSCGADRRLEKPFDADTLRSIVKDLVPAVNDNAISNFLSFPNLPDFVEKQKAPPPSFANSSFTSSQDSLKDEPLILADDPEELEDFSQVPLPNLNSQSYTNSTLSKNSNEHNNESWTAGNLDRFKIHLPENSEISEESYEEMTEAPVALAGSGMEGAEIQLADLDETPSKAQRPQTSTNLDPAFIEQVLREQVRTVLQDIAWKIIPDITERIVREEIKKLLKDAEKLS